MPSTLKIQKPVLKTKLTKILYQAAYDAMMEMSDPGDVSISELDSAAKAKMKERAQIAANKFAKKFSQSAAGDMTDAINEFVSGIGISVLVKGTLTTAVGGGPVTGTISTTAGDISIL